MISHTASKSYVMVEYPPDDCRCYGTPLAVSDKQDIGFALDLLRAHPAPILGVCLGHQAIGVAFGAKVSRLLVGSADCLLKTDRQYPFHHSRTCRPRLACPATHWSLRFARVETAPGRGERLRCGGL